MKREGFIQQKPLYVIGLIHEFRRILFRYFANTKAKAYIASMKSDLRNLVTAEEAYFADSVKYSATTACTTPPTAGAVNFCVTTGKIGRASCRERVKGGGAVMITNNNLTTPRVKFAIFIKTEVLGPAVAK